MPLIFTPPTAPTPPPRTPWKDVKQGDTFRCPEAGAGVYFRTETYKGIGACHLHGGTHSPGTLVTVGSLFAEDGFKEHGVILVNIKCVIQDA